MHTDLKSFGEILKDSRQNAGITIEELAEKADISVRYLYRLENEGKKPSYDVLYKLIRSLAVSADVFFYPEQPPKNFDIEEISHILCQCDESYIAVIKAAARKALEQQNKK